MRAPWRHTKAHIMSNHDDFTLRLLNLFSPSRLDGDWADDLRKAAAAIEAVLAGTAPDDHALASAPQLSEWTPVLSPYGLRLTGHATGHPRLIGTNRPIMTSPIVVADAAAGWVRTHSRFYRIADRKEARNVH